MTRATPPVRLVPHDEKIVVHREGQHAAVVIPPGTSRQAIIDVLTELADYPDFVDHYPEDDTRHSALVLVLRTARHHTRTTPPGPDQEPTGR